jgi:hypothetical protein
MLVRRVEVGETRKEPTPVRFSMVALGEPCHLLD